MDESSSAETAKQALRIRRFAGAAATYALGLAILVLCSAFGMVDGWRIALVGLSFATANLVFWALFRSGLNRRCADPSLTQAQLGVAATQVLLILVLGERLQFVAVPFYSSLFVFAMLRLRPREMVAFELYVLASYALAIGLRASFFAGRLDLRLEAVYAVLVVSASIWFAIAAGYISELRARLRSSLETIERFANRDALTDLWNRRHVDSLLEIEMQRMVRQGQRLCVGLIDIDHFKAVNDRWGHAAGDEVLRQIAAAMKQQLRSFDHLGRYGGEEFLLILPATALDEAAACARRLLTQVAELAPLGPGQGAVTVSIGLGACVAAETPQQLLSRVDAALYRAKREGRNRLVLSAPGQVAASADEVARAALSG